MTLRMACSRRPLVRLPYLSSGLRTEAPAKVPAFPISHVDAHLLRESGRGKNLSATRKAKIGKAKEELRALYRKGLTAQRNQ